MKRISLSHWMPVCRTLCLRLFWFAGFLAAPEISHAQLYVAQDGSTTVGEYNSASGAVINANYITVGLNYPEGLALSADGHTLFVANGGNGTIGKYNVTEVTGASPINVNFISEGLSTPSGIALSADGGTLFVANYTGSSAVGEYNATTGAVINANFIPTTTHLGNSTAVALSSDGSTIFVAHYAQYSDIENFGLGSVGSYNAKTGAAINAKLITGLKGPVALAVSGDALYVVNSGYTAVGSGGVGQYNSGTGSAINANLITALTGSDGIAVLGNTVFVSYKGTSGLGSVAAYDPATGVKPIITGPFNPYGLAVKAGSTSAVAPHIIFSGEPIDTLPPQSVVIGQKIELSAKPAGSGVAQAWEVKDSAGNAAKLVAGYTTPPIPIAYTSTKDKSMALVTGVTSSTFSNSAGTSFYFVTPGTFTVQYHYTGSDGKPTSIEAKFDVDGPVATKGSVTTIPIAGVPAPVILYNPPLPVLQFHGFEFPIKFQEHVVPAVSHGGNSFWTQIVLSNVIQGKTQAIGLDSAFPYAGSAKLAQGCYNAGTSDSPNVAVTRSYEGPYTAQYSFNMYLMWKWKGSTPEIIPVSLGLAHWSFTVNLLQKDGVLAQNPSGQLSAGVAQVFKPITEFSDPAQGFPQWDGVATATAEVTPCGPPP
jgi:hypothetical protein